MLSVFTPSHDPRFLDECWRSLEAQTYRDFEWIVVLNQGAEWEPPAGLSGGADLTLFHAPFLRGVGMAKAWACSTARGEILVELDHDDLLATEALEEIVRAFEENPDAVLVYSDSAQIEETGDPDTSTWDQNNGWQYGFVEVEVGKQALRGGKFLGSATSEPRPIKVLAVSALEPTPHNVSLIWFAPNHVRAFRRDAYEDAGGYDPDRTFLDDQDLMCRLYRLGRFVHIERCLYLQRCHPAMTQVQPAINPAIQSGTIEMYDANVEANALAWAKRNDLRCFDLGGATGSPPGYTCIDRRESAGWVGDVFEVFGRLADSTVGVFRAVDFLEHIEDKIRLINEIHRLLAPDGLLLSCTPSTDGRGAWQDPTHVAGYNENSFWYYTDAAYASYVPEIEARFQTSRLVTYFPSDWHREHEIPYVQANLIALKEGGRRNGGYLYW